MMASLEVIDMSIGYKDRCVQRSLSFHIIPGEFVTLIGSNGVGKSTLLKTIAGILPPLHGQVIYGDKDLLTLPNKERSKYLSLILTQDITQPHLSVYELITLGRYPYTSFFGTLTDNDKDIINDTINLLNLQQYIDRPFVSLSDGEKQQVLLAMCLVQQTPIILLDEPTAHLDLPNRIKTFQRLYTIAHEQHKIIILSTHELSLAIRYATKLLVLSGKDKYYFTTPTVIQQEDILSEVFGLNLNDYYGKRSDSYQ